MTDWRICGLRFPSLRRLHTYDRESVNAALHLTVGFVQLMTAYLGIQLPFPIVLHNGTASIRISSMSPSGAGSTRAKVHLTRAAYARCLAPRAPSAAEERPPSDAREYAQELAQFRDAWMMLVYDLLYVSHTQGVDVSALRISQCPLWLLHYMAHLPHAVR